MQGNDEDDFGLHSLRGCSTSKGLQELTALLETYYCTFAIILNYAHFSEVPTSLSLRGCGGRRSFVGFTSLTFTTQFSWYPSLMAFGPKSKSFDGFEFFILLHTGSKRQLLSKNQVLEKKK